MNSRMRVGQTLIITLGFIYAEPLFAGQLPLKSTYGTPEACAAIAERDALEKLDRLPSEQRLLLDTDGVRYGAHTCEFTRLMYSVSLRASTYWVLRTRCEPASVNRKFSVATVTDPRGYGFSEIGPMRLLRCRTKEMVKD